MYTVDVRHEAKRHIAAFKKSGRAAVVRKIDTLLSELAEHPYTGTGKPEMLRGNKSGLWSRRITQEHRLIYSVNEDIVTVIVLSAKGHYE